MSTTSHALAAGWWVSTTSTQDLGGVYGEGVTQESRRRDPLSSGLTPNPSAEEVGLVQIAPLGEIGVECAKTTQNSVV